MNRKSVLLGIGVLVLVAGFVSGMVLLVRREPAFYQAMALPEGKERKEQSSAFMTEFVGALDNVLNERPWDCRLTADQINSYFEEDFVRNGIAEKVLPEGIREPRIAIDSDKVRLAFRYGGPPWSTIVSIDLGLWLAPKEPNVIALELQGMRAGALPINAQSLLESIYETARQQNIDPSPWYRHKGNPVTLLRFQADRPSPTIRLQRLELQPGVIVISGCPNDMSPLGAALPGIGQR